jgi:hypothetical protein
MHARGLPSLFPDRAACAAHVCMFALSCAITGAAPVAMDGVGGPFLLRICQLTCMLTERLISGRFAS